MSRATGTSEVPEVSTEDRIIEATARHLAELGPRAVEVRAICLELDLSPSLVNYYFSSPSELIWRAALFGYEQHVEDMKRRFDRAKDGKDALEKWVLGTIEWTKANPGIAAVIDFPMLALSTEDGETTDAFVKEMSAPSRANVTTLGSAVYSLMTGKPPRRLSTARVAALIKLNTEYAFWISTVGFGGQGAAMWVAGRKPYNFVWKAFGFSPDKQIRSTLRGLVAQISANGDAGLPEIAEGEEA
jgi:AcrR family transcriptional regulator